MYKLAFFVIAFTMLTSCGAKTKTNDDFSKDTATPFEESATNPTDAVAYDLNRGIGKHTSVDLGDKLDEAMAAEGERIQSVKCSSCNKLSNEKLVGPRWKGFTERQKPEWIMNFITNPDPIIDKDPALQAQRELCLVHMLNQALTDIDARNLLESTSEQ